MKKYGSFPGIGSDKTSWLKKTMNLFHIHLGMFFCFDSLEYTVIMRSNLFR